VRVFESAVILIHLALKSNALKGYLRLSLGDDWNETVCWTVWQAATFGPAAGHSLALHQLR
jgi:glutathione S-transferase